MDVRQYALAVRAALGGLDPRAAAHLLDDLEEHLAEVAAESDVPLAERLGPPESYAAELLAAYASGGAPVRSRPARRRRLGVAVSVVVVLLAAVGYVAWQTAMSSERANPWSYDRLTTQARAGQVSRVEVAGDDVVAIDRAGQRHQVIDAAPVDNLAQVMTSEGVDMVFRSAASSNWGAALLPNLILLLALAPVVGLALLVVLLARPRPRPGTG